MDFERSDVEVAPWWRTPSGWAWPIIIVLLTAVAAARLVPRPVCRLVVLRGEDRGCRYEVFELPVNLGSSDGNDLVRGEPGISRNHATVQRAERGGIEIVDLHSTSGVRINGEKVNQRRLRRGDRIGLGEDLEFSFEG
jgi:hypothetical protein